MLWTHEIIEIAKSHIGRGDMVSSAQLCLDDAVALFYETKFEQADQRALKSIAYSVGMLHPDYYKIKKAIEKRQLEIECFWS